MEQHTPKFRLRLNLFDSIVLILALAVGAFLLWTALKPAASPVGETTSTSTVRYTVRFQRWIEGTSSLIQPGDKLVDNIKNYEMGSVVSSEVVPAESLQLDNNSRQYVLAGISGYEDILVTVESPCTESSEAITLGGGYALRVGAIAYIRGEGYMASGPIISIEREGQK
ncbi:MAG: DUF4330 domain-containing protein [Lawsonibacter sp.]